MKKRYKVMFSGFAYVEAEDTQEAEKEFENDNDYYRETVIDETALLESENKE